MITLKKLIGNNYNIPNISLKIRNLQYLLDNIINPLENMFSQYHIYLIKGLLPKWNIFLKNDYYHILKQLDHINGYGIDIGTGNIFLDKEIYEYIINSDLPYYGVHLENGYIHISFR